jgi:hypothetical protein
MYQLTARVWCATLCCVCLLAAARPATARERLAVLIVSNQEPKLADDLTEVVIAELAEHRGRELVGMRELRNRLAGVLPVEGLGACVDDAACLARLGAAASAAEAVIAKVSAHDDGYLLDLALTDTGTGKVEARVSTAVPPGFAELVVAVRAGLSELFAPRVEDASPPVPAVATPPLIARETGSTRVPRWVPYAGAAATALAAVSFSAAAITGTIAMQEATGSTRANAQGDLGRRETYATTANGLLVAGSVLAIAACAAFAWWWRGAREH